ASPASAAGEVSAGASWAPAVLASFGWAADAAPASSGFGVGAASAAAAASGFGVCVASGASSRLVCFDASGVWEVTEVPPFRSRSSIAEPRRRRRVRLRQSYWQSLNQRSRGLEQCNDRLHPMEFENPHR